MAKDQGIICLPMNYSVITLMLLFSLISPSISRPGSVKIEASVLDTICSGTIDPAFCLSALKSDQRIATADLPGLAQISIDLAQAKAATALTLLGSLSEGETDSMLRQRYDACTTHYSTASGDLTKAAEALKSGSYGDIGSYASSAMDSAESCGDEFEVPPKNPSPPLTSSNTDMAKLCNIVFNVGGALP